LFVMGIFISLCPLCLRVKNEIKITQGHGEHREMGHGVKDTSCEMARIDEAMAAGRDADGDDQLCKEIGTVLQLIIL